MSIDDREEVIAMNHANVMHRSTLALTVGAAGFLISGLVVQAAVVPMTTVSDDRWSYPWTPDALVSVSIVFAAMNALVCIGLLGVARSGAAGTGRIGPLLAIGGTALLFVAQLASIPIRDAAMDDTSAMIVAGLFAAGSAVAGAGLIMMGLAAAPGPVRHGLIAAGVASLAILGLAPLNAIAAGVAFYGLALLAVGSALSARAVQVA